MAGVGKVSVTDSGTAPGSETCLECRDKIPSILILMTPSRKHAYLDTKRRSWSNAGKGNFGDIRQHPSHGLTDVRGI